MLDLDALSCLDAMLAGGVKPAERPAPVRRAPPPEAAAQCPHLRALEMESA